MIDKINRKEFLKSAAGATLGAVVAANLPVTRIADFIPVLQEHARKQNIKNGEWTCRPRLPTHDAPSLAP